MGGIEGGCRLTFAYGLGVSLVSLRVALDAYTLTSHALSFVTFLSGRSLGGATDKASLRVPPEVWALVRAELIRFALLDADAAFARKVWTAARDEDCRRGGKVPMSMHDLLGDRPCGCVQKVLTKEASAVECVNPYADEGGEQNALVKLLGSYGLVALRFFPCTDGALSQPPVAGGTLGSGADGTRDGDEDDEEDEDDAECSEDGDDEDKDEEEEEDAECSEYGDDEDEDEEEDSSGEGFESRWNSGVFLSYPMNQKYVDYDCWFDKPSSYYTRVDTTLPTDSNAPFDNLVREWNLCLSTPKLEPTIACRTRGSRPALASADNARPGWHLFTYCYVQV